MLSVTASPASLHPATTVATATATAAAAAAAAATTPPLRAVAVPIVSPFPVPPAAGPVRVIAAVFGSRSVGRKTISIFFSETMFEATEEEEARMENTRHYTRREGMGGNWLHTSYGLFWKTLFVCEGKYRPQEGLEQVPRWYGMCQKCNDGRSSTFFYLVCGSGDEAYLLQQAFIGGHTRD